MLTSAPYFYKGLFILKIFGLYINYIYFRYMKIIIDIPSEIHTHLILLAAKDGRKTKPYTERIIISHVERKLKNQK